MIGFDSYTQYLDIEGNEVERTPMSHPYSYDTYVVWKSESSDKSNHTVYSDRLLQWDYKKTRKLMAEHFKDSGDSYDGRDPTDIEKFLSAWLDKDVKLLTIMKGCNQSSGYPYWVFLLKMKEGK